MPAGATTLTVVSAAHLLNAQGRFEPQRSSNVQLVVHDIAGVEPDVLRLAANTLPLPKMSNTVLEKMYGNTMRRYAGRQMYEDLTMQFTDYVDVAVAKALMSWRYLVSDPETGQIGMAKDYKKTAEIHLLPPNGVAVTNVGSIAVSPEYLRTWEVVGMWPSNADFGDGDLSGDSELFINVTFSLDVVIPRKGLNPRGDAAGGQTAGG